MDTEPTSSAHRPEPVVHDSFETLVRTAVEEHVLKHWRSSPRKTVALILASGQAPTVLWGSLQRASTEGKLAVAVAGIMVLRTLLRLGIRGPWAWVALGVSAAGAGALYYKNRSWLNELADAYRARLAEARSAHEAVLQGYSAGDYGLEQRNLMLDGLLQRLMKQLDEV